MWLPKGNTTKKGARNGSVAVAIDKDKGSQHALRWSVENLLTKGQTVVLIHVLHKSHPSSGRTPDPMSGVSPNKEKQAKDLFLTFHCYCTRKDIHCLDVMLEDTDIVKAITEYASYAAIENLVLGSPSRNGFIRRFKADVPSSVSKAAPDFCTVFVISKGKVSSVRNASRVAPYSSPLIRQIEDESAIMSDEKTKISMSFRDRNTTRPRVSVDEPMKSPFGRGKALGRSFPDSSETETDISFVSSSRPSTDRCSSIYLNDFSDSARTSRMSTSSEQSLGAIGIKFMDQSQFHDFSMVSQDSNRTSCSCSSQGLEDVESEMRRLKIELKQTMDLYSNACKEALAAKNEAVELQRWRLGEEKRLEDAHVSEEVAMSIMQKEKDSARAAQEAADAAKRVAELECKKRAHAEMQAYKDSEDMKKVLDCLSMRYRRYSIDDIELATDYFAESRKIGEGGYGPVFKCYLDHTPVAVKVLRPDAAQGRSQFQKEIEVLSCIRHPNMVLLLGACPEYGILVYEYMAKGSLDDRLFRRGNTPSLSWQLRFRISAEIATGLLFLHQTKPEPLVHRDLKPGNILLDHNYVSKVSDVGLARLVPAVAENVTQCHVTSAAGTFCYIDPEYQQTGMLGVKSDVYSLGIMLLQIITAKQPMGLAYYVEQAIENGTIKDMLDPTVPDWPVEEATNFAKLALKCAELRRKDRPDLGKEVLPELNRLRELADENMGVSFSGSAAPSSNTSQVSTPMGNISDPHVNSGSVNSESSISSETEKTAE